MFIDGWGRPDLYFSFSLILIPPPHFSQFSSCCSCCCCCCLMVSWCLCCVQLLRYAMSRRRRWRWGVCTVYLKGGTPGGLFTLFLFPSASSPLLFALLLFPDQATAEAVAAQQLQMQHQKKKERRNSPVASAFIHLSTVVILCALEWRRTIAKRILLCSWSSSNVSTAIFPSSFLLPNGFNEYTFCHGITFSHHQVSELAHYTDATAETSRIVRNVLEAGKNPHRYYSVLFNSAQLGSTS